ncbi:CDP-glycerol glycerophosphotransferase [Agromyces terreus]|uniref:CDP-glycerol glycerophosphotransferase n=1 Tax=Agromyces terreus TaxID=424795 RepID=A0A9X2H181_9MICO|nr:CDP-glycerol glycerophosphotransferase family protein [Agromyces terreus]MCP2371316.1 CDP-glycerol glycerophosphotransferase [Agromyces terreus]
MTRAFGAGPRAGLLSIVVPAYGVEQYIEACLRSLAKQNYRNIEILVIDDGSLDRSGDIARRMARRDPRIRVVRQENGGLSSARNTGAALARGEFITFIDSDDVVDRHVFTQAIDALRVTGSDFTVSPYRRKYRNSYPPAAPWVRSAHAIDRLGCTLEEFPEIQVNAVAWSKVYRRQFWIDAALQFPVGLLYEDQAVSARAYAMARSFDVLSRVSINWRMREDQSSISQQVTTPRNIADHWRAVKDSLDVLEEYGHTDARNVRVAQLLTNNLSEFFLLIREMPTDSWTGFVDFVRYLVGEAQDDATWNQIDARNKMLAHIVASGDQALALQFLEHDGWKRERYDAELRGDGLYARPSMDAIAESALPPAAFRLAPRESRLIAEMTRAGLENDHVTLSVMSYIEGLDLVASPPSARAELVPERGEAAEPLEVAWAVDELALAPRSSANVDRSGALLRVHVPIRMFQGHPENYRIRVELSAGGLTREALVTAPREYPRVPAIPIEGGLVVDLIRTSGNVTTFSCTAPRPSVATWSLEGSSLTVALTEGEFQAIALVSPRDRFGLRRREARVKRRAGKAEATLSVSSPGRRASRFGPGDWYLTARDSSGIWHWVGMESVVDTGARLTPLLTQTKTAHGHLVPATTATIRSEIDALITDVQLGDDGLQFTFASPRSVAVDAVSGTRRISLSVGSASDRLTLPLTISEFGRTSIPLPRGGYRVEAADGSASIDQRLHLQLPLRFKTPQHLITVRAHNWATLAVDIDVARPDGDRGSGNVERLRREAAITTTRRARRSVLFRCLYSESANDSALALHKRLLERGADLDLIWAARDYSIYVPEGGIRVIENSREYFEAFANADYIVVNVHQPDWFEKRDGQVVIETFHGYPFKANGTDWWRRLGFSPERIESFYRRADEWDYLVSPAPYATPYLRQFFRDDQAGSTEILELGYPRNDTLIDAESAQRRTAARGALGISETETAVLYAPTFRDYLSANDMSAARTNFLDTDDLLRRLGPGHRLLMRGHPFNARHQSEADRSAIDVTNHPDINDLILASDAAILDYSSLRFDYALTDKPMIFLTPDRERYFTERPGFFEYEPTAPGPLVTTTAEVAKLLADPIQLGQDWSTARADFRTAFTPLEDGEATDRLIDAVFAPRGDVTAPDDKSRAV